MQSINSCLTLPYILIVRDLPSISIFIRTEGGLDPSSFSVDKSGSFLVATTSRTNWLRRISVTWATQEVVSSHKRFSMNCDCSYVNSRRLSSANKTLYIRLYSNHQNHPCWPALSKYSRPPIIEPFIIGGSTCNAQNIQALCHKKIYCTEKKC